MKDRERAHAELATIEAAWRDQLDPDRAWDLGSFHAAEGNAAKAVPLLRQALHAGSGIAPLTVGQLRIDPWWDEIRDSPEFQALLAKTASVACTGKVTGHRRGRSIWPVVRSRGSWRDDAACRSREGTMGSGFLMNFIRHCSTIVTCTLAFPLSARAALAPEEQRIVEWLRTQQPAAIALLERAVKIDSASENIAGVRAAGELFAAELKSIGLTPRWIPLPEESKRAGHLFAEREGTKGRRLLLIGHLDTVLKGGTFSTDGTTGRGSGVNDMKGGDVVLIYALKALQATGALEGTRIIVAMTGDEESVGDPVELSRRELVLAAKRSDVALAFETGRSGEATVARRGSSTWQLDITSPSGHSSGIFSAAMGSGAVYEMARIIEGFHTELRKLPGLTANVALVAGGADVSVSTFRFSAEGKDNIIPAHARARGDLRAVSVGQLEQAEAAMRAVVARHRPRADPKFTIEHRYPPMATEPRHLAILAVYDEVSRDLGQGPVAANDPAQRGAGDSAFAAPHCAVLDGLGPYGTGAHAERETVDLRSLIPQATRAALLIYRLTR